MCPSWGVTPAGFAVKPLAQIQNDMNDDVLAVLDPAFDLSPGTPDGQVLGIVANGYSSLWELAQVVWNAFNRQNVEGAGLDNLGDITGTPREGPSYTQVVCDLTFAPGTTLFAASVWDETTGALTNGTLVANVAGNQTFQFANVFPVQQPSGGGVVTGVLMQASTIGTTASVNPGTVTDISVPVTGWTAVTNPLAESQAGTDGELDSAYAIRQEQDVTGQGSCSASATAAALNELGAAQEPPVALTVTVLENTLNIPQTINGITLPPHTYLAVIYDGGTGWAISAAGQAAIAAVIYANKPGGIPANVAGTIFVQVEDPFLGTQTVGYTVPTQRQLFISSTVVPRSGVIWTNLELALTQALVSAAVAPDLAGGIPPVGQLAPGAFVIGSQLSAVMSGVQGLFDIQSLTFGFSASPVNTAPLAVAANEVAVISAINVVLTEGTSP